MTINIPIRINGDNIFELTELFTVSLAFPGAPPLSVFIVPDSAQVTILDDDGQCYNNIIARIHQLFLCLLNYRGLLVVY